MKFLPSLFLAVFLLLATTSARAQSFEETLGLQTTRITLQEVIHRLLERSLDVKVEWMNWAVADQQVVAASGKFDPFFYLDANYVDSRLPQNALEFAQTGGVFVPTNQPFLFREQNLLASMGVAGRLPTGTFYSVFTNTGKFRNDLNRVRPPALYYPEYSTAVGISLTQPLLRDFGPNVQLAEVRVTRRNRAIADYKWEVLLQKALVDVILEYLDLNLVMENVALKKEVLMYSRNMVAEVNQAISEGKGADISPPEAELAVAVAEEDVVKAMMLVAERQVKLKNQILASGAEETGSILVPKDPLRMLAVKMDREGLVRTALLRRPDHLAAGEEVQKQTIVSKYMDNQRLPRLDIQGSLTSNGLSGSYGSAYDRAGGRQGYEAQVGIRFSVPLGNRTARANSATADYLRQQAQLNLARSELNVTVEISNLIARVKGGVARLNSTKKSTGLAEDVVERVKQARAAGVVNSLALVKARLQVIEARTRELEALVEYNKSVVQLTLASGMLLERYGIHLNRQPGVPTAVTASTRR